MSDAESVSYRKIFDAIQGLYMVLDRNLIIVAATDAYLRATGQSRSMAIGRYVFDVFPDNPNDPNASAVKNSTASFQRVLTLKCPDTIPIQRHDMRVRSAVDLSAASATFVEKYWRPLNSPVLGDDGDVCWIIHRVDDVTDEIRERHQPTQAPRQQAMIDLIVQMRPANWLLTNIDDAMFDLMSRHLTLAKLPTGMVLTEAFEPVRFAYFPLSGLVSMSRHLADGSSAEVTVGSAVGMIGASALLDQAPGVTDANVLISGSALVMKADILHEIMALHPDLRRDLTNKVLPPLMAQLSQTVVCNTRHTLDQRIARWLLMASDSIGHSRIDVSHDNIAMMLGVRRAGITQALGRLSDLGIVSTSRGSVEITDVPRLKAQSCECYTDIIETLSTVYNVPLGRSLDDSRLTSLQGRYFELERQMNSSQ